MPADNSRGLRMSADIGVLLTIAAVLDGLPLTEEALSPRKQAAAAAAAASKGRVSLYSEL